MLRIAIVEDDAEQFRNTRKHLDKVLYGLMLGCGKDKTVRLFKELDMGSGIGLIERRKQGQGKPARVYVKKFTLPPLIRLIRIILNRAILIYPSIPLPPCTLHRPIALAID